ncbi:Zinc finger CCHC domain-containing protein 7 [Spatholobus suberectus]|nr:Zinc finger CCHC domain-containing protein 7 [Spatholobus suberectus]
MWSGEVGGLAWLVGLRMILGVGCDVDREEAVAGGVGCGGAETICARTARGLVIMQENALMLQFATIVAFLGTLLLNVPQRHCAGTAKNQATWPAIVQMRAFATPVVNLDTVLGNWRWVVAGGGARVGGYRDVICRNCQQLGHMSRDCMGPLMICHNCGGRGHLAYECPSGRFMDRYPRRCPLSVKIVMLMHPPSIIDSVATTQNIKQRLFGQGGTESSQLHSVDLSIPRTQLLMAESGEDIPVIDLHRLSSPSTAEQEFAKLHHALHSWGCFQVHAIPFTS